LKVLPKNGCLLSFECEKQISPLLVFLEKYLEKSPNAIPWKKSVRRPWLVRQNATSTRNGTKSQNFSFFIVKLHLEINKTSTSPLLTSIGGSKWK